MLGRLLIAVCLVAGTEFDAEDVAPERVDEILDEAAAQRRLTELAARTNALQSFIAQYRAGTGADELTLTLTFEAPDRAKLAWHGGETHTDMWLVEGRQRMHSDRGGELGWCDVDFAEILTWNEEYEDALRELLPVPSSERAAIGPGPTFSMDTAADEKSPGGVALKVQLGWSSDRDCILAWLSDPKLWVGARCSADHMIRDGAVDSVLSLSLATGFFDSIRLKSDLKLERLEVDVDIPESTWTIPARPPSARDLSTDFSTQQTRFAISTQRMRVYRKAMLAAESVGIEDVGWIAKVQRAWSALHTEVHARTSKDWVADIEGRIDATLNRFTAEYAAVQQDPVSRERLDAAAREWRAGLQAKLNEGAERNLTKLPIPSGPEIDAGVAAAVHEMELAASRAVFEQQAAELLARCDDGLVLAQSGR